MHAQARVVAANGRPTVKLSDNPAEIESYKQVFGIGEQVEQVVRGPGARKKPDRRGFKICRPIHPRTPHPAGKALP